MFGKRWLMALLVAATGSGIGSAFAQEPIRLGWVGPLSPPGNYTGGQEMKWAVQLKADEINAAGGVLGRPLEIFYGDTRGQPASGGAAATRLVTRDDVAAIFGGFHSSAQLAVIDVAHEYGVPWVGTDVWSDQITARQYPEVFRIAPTNSLLYTEAATWVAEQGFENVAILAESTDFGQGGASVAAEMLEENGVQHSVATVSMEQQDFTPALLRLTRQEPGPDLLWMIMAGQAQYQLVNQACQLGIAPTMQTAMMGGVGLLEEEVWELAGECAKHLLVISVGVPKSQWTDDTRAFIEAFQQRYDRAPTSVAMKAYDTLGVLAAAIEDAGSADGEAIIDALEGIDYTGVLGAYEFSTDRDPEWAYHQFMDAPVTILQYTQMHQEPAQAPILYPEKWASTDQVLPVD